MRHIQWSTGCGTFSGPPRAHFPMHEDVTSGGPLVGNQWTTGCEGRLCISRGNQACARIANAKRTTQSRDAALSAIYIEGTRLTFELARSPWQPVRFFENNSEIHDIYRGLMNKYFLILWILADITVWIWMKLMPKLTLYFVHNVCKWQEFSCFYTAVEAIFSAVCDHFWTKTSISTSSFWGSDSHFLDDLDYLLCNAGVSFWFYPIEIHFF